MFSFLHDALNFPLSDVNDDGHFEGPSLFDERDVGSHPVPSPNSIGTFAVFFAGGGVGW